MCMLYKLRLTEAPNGAGAAQLRPGATKNVFAGIMLFSTIPYGLRPGKKVEGRGKTERSETNPRASAVTYTILSFRNYHKVKNIHHN